jgi:hypothetical protein
MRQLFSDLYEHRTEDKYTYILQEKRLVHTRGKGNMVIADRGTRDYTVHDRGIRLGKTLRVKIDQKNGEKNTFLGGEDFDIGDGRLTWESIPIVDSSRISRLSRVLSWRSDNF